MPSHTALRSPTLLMARHAAAMPAERGKRLVAKQEVTA